MRRSVYGLGKAQQFWTCFVIRALLVHGLSSVESGLEEGRVTGADPMTVLRRLLLPAYPFPVVSLQTPRLGMRRISTFHLCKARRALIKLLYFSLF